MPTQCVGDLHRIESWPQDTLGFIEEDRGYQMPSTNPDFGLELKNYDIDTMPIKTGAGTTMGTRTTYLQFYSRLGTGSVNSKPTRSESEVL